MLNKIFVLLCFLFLGCNSSKNLNSNITSSEISGTWYQVDMILFNDTSSHMFAPVEWVFAKGRCQINIFNSKEYEFATKDSKVVFSPIKGEDYDEWDHKIFFDNEFDLSKNDSCMVWIKKGLHKIVFERSL